MKFKRLVITLIALSFVTGCTNIPQAAIDVNKQVSVGINTLGENGIEMVNAWEKSAFNMLDEKWDKVYQKADATYRSNKGVAAGAALTVQQQKDIAGLAALIRGEVRTKIRQEASSMRNIINSNTQSTVEANESITDLLISANAITNIQQSAIKKVGSLIPIPPAISEFITSALQNQDLN